MSLLFNVVYSVVIYSLVFFGKKLSKTSSVPMIQNIRNGKKQNIFRLFSWNPLFNYSECEPQTSFRKAEYVGWGSDIVINVTTPNTSMFLILWGPVIVHEEAKHCYFTAGLYRL